MVGIIAIIVCIKKKKSGPVDIEYLPDRLRWFFDQKRLKESGWKIIDNTSTQHLSKKITTDKRYMAKFDSIFVYLEGDQINFKEVYAVYNITLLSAFSSQYSIISTRHKDSPAIFCKQNWKESQFEHRAWVYSKYSKRVSTFDWNRSTELPIIPAVHGTDKIIAWNICASGFAALSALDSGFYGKGIYFTSSCLYAVPYFASKKNPTILVCLLIAGNVRPIIESRDGTDSFMGVAIDPGYQSHYVCCKRDGLICPINFEKYYDEIVISQEGQIVPIFVVHVDKSCLPSLISKFQRELPKPTENTNRDSLIRDPKEPVTDRTSIKLIEEDYVHF
jgi:hypothetical protein